MANEQLGEIVIAPRVLEKIIAIATAMVEGVHSFANKSMSDSLSMYLYLEYGISVPTVAVAIQKAVKSAVSDMAEVELSAVNIHVAGIVPEKSPKPDLKDLFDEDFLND